MDDAELRVGRIDRPEFADAANGIQEFEATICVGHDAVDVVWHLCQTGDRCQQEGGHKFYGDRGQIPVYFLSLVRNIHFHKSFVVSTLSVEAAGCAVVRCAFKPRALSSRVILRILVYV